MTSAFKPLFQRRDAVATFCAAFLFFFVFVAAVSHAAVLENVLGSARPKAGDLIVLDSGEQIEGIVLNPQFQLHASYGSVPIESQYLAALFFNVGSQHADQAVTVNRNRITGFVNEPIEVRSGQGTTNRFEKHLLAKVIFGLRETESGLSRSSQYVVLDNGDLLSGRFALPEVQFVTPSGSRTAAPQEIDTIRFSKSFTAVQVLLTNGFDRAGSIGIEPLSVQMDFGPLLVLPPNRLNAIYARPDFLPVEARRLFASQNHTTSAQEPPPGFAPPAGLVWIAPGKFILGSPSHERGRDSDEDPETEVVLSRGFWIGRCEVTQGEYLEATKSNPSHAKGDPNLPVERVTWHEAREYCVRLTELARTKTQLPEGYVYRLPTEAEWEYACRAGTSTRFSFGDDPDETQLNAYAWSVENSDSATHPVGKLKPNPWGLHDMHGNVWEWCHDRWAGSYPGGTVTDYAGPADGWLRVARGGSWLYGVPFNRSANRDDYSSETRCSDLGFRVVLGPELK